MESPKCSFASCEHEVVGTAQIVSLSLSESEVLQLRYEIEMKYLCGVHYNDQFKKYVYWHNKKVCWSLQGCKAEENQTGGDWARHS